MTIYDIAKAAGVSASSVSRVINNKTGVKEETRRKIQALLEKHNYSPDLAARSLVNQASNIIGILVADIRTSHHTDSAYYVERQMAKIGYCSMIFNTGTDDSDREFYIRTLVERRVEGAVLVGSSFQQEAVRKSIMTYLNDVPIVMINGFFDAPNVYGVLSDERRGVESCVDLLARKGKKHLAYVNTLHETPSNALKRQGFQNGVVLQSRVENSWVYNADYSIKGGYEATRAILSDHPEVDGIVYAVDQMAAGGVHALCEAGIETPGQVAVVGIDNSEYAEVCRPRLTSLDNKLCETSIMAANVLSDLIMGKPVVRQMLLPSVIVERQTT